MEKGFSKMERIYVRMRKRIRKHQSDTIELKDIAFVETDSETKHKLEQIPIHKVSKKDGEFIVIESFILLAILRKLFPKSDIEFIGPEETIVEVQSKQYKPSILFTVIIWIVLFVGTAMSIMNFHYDVSMPEVHEKLHYIFTGEKNKRPLWIQIPYSIGLGVGMVLFLNHWFKKRINEEPSPLEIELFKYEKDINDYIRHFENELNDDERHF